jgi:hypothetical protein
MRSGVRILHTVLFDSLLVIELRCMDRIMKYLILTVLAASGTMASFQTAQANDVFYFTSSPGSWVGGGQTLTLTSPSTSFSASRYYDQGAYTDAVTLSAGGYYFYLVEPNYTLPTVGFYNATRWPFMGTGAGMALLSPGRGDNTLTGWFNVLQADYDPVGNVVSFAVDFTQYDEGNPANWVSGSWRYNSTIPVPEPSAIALFGVGTLVMLALRNKTAVAGK